MLLIGGGFRAKSSATKPLSTFREVNRTKRHLQRKDGYVGATIDSNEGKEAEVTDKVRQRGQRRVGKVSANKVKGGRRTKPQYLT